MTESVGAIRALTAEEILEDFSRSYGGAAFKPLYETEVVVHGGKHGHARLSGTATSSDGQLKVDLAIPRELGGSGEGTNPEQLFAAGYASCFHGALALVARSMKIDVSRASIRARVIIGRDPSDGGFALKANLAVGVPEVAPDLAQELVSAAKQVCPYAKATAGNIETTVVLESAS